MSLLDYAAAFVVAALVVRTAFLWGRSVGAGDAAEHDCTVRLSPMAAREVAQRLEIMALGRECSGGGGTVLVTVDSAARQIAVR